MFIGSRPHFMGGDVARKVAPRRPLVQGKLVECEKKGWLGKTEGRNSVDLHNNKVTTSSLSPANPDNTKKSDIPRPTLTQGRLVLNSEKKFLLINKAEILV